MKHDLSQATFIIPVRIESLDRLRNVITTTAFLIENFNTNIILKEVDKKSVFEAKVLPVLNDILDKDVVFTNFNYIFEENHDSLFHRQRILNEMVMEADTNIVVNYDCDVILPMDSYLLAYDMIINGKSDVVYPYGKGEYQKQVDANDDVVSNFLETGDYYHLDSGSRIHTSDFGWAQFFKRSVYIEGGLENENFRAYAPEDKERHFRFSKLGYNVDRIADGWVYHLEHVRGDNSWFTNPHMESNMAEWEKISKMAKEELKNYYSNQDYLKKYVNI
tara:strand:- start:323 stop:1150 length:828 start_codon:yes stop_codon:yes gene_type:complete